MKSRWPLLLATVLVVPAGLLTAWATLMFGGSIDEQVREEESRGGQALRETVTRLGRDLRGTPIGEAPKLHEAESEGRLSSAARIGLDFAGQGANEQALLYFDSVKAPLPARVRLAKARAEIGLNRTADALRTLAASQSKAGDALSLDGVPLALTTALLRARAGDHEAVWRRVVAGELHVPPIHARQVVDSLIECGVDRDSDAVADFLWSARARQVLSLDLVDVEGGDSLVALPGGGVLIRDRSELVSLRALSAAIRDVGPRVGERFAVWVGKEIVGDADGEAAKDSLAAIEFAGTRLVATPVGTRGSASLRLVANGCLVLALVAFLLGNVVLFSVARRTAALSKLKTEFIDVVSHELRTPLTALSVKAEMLACGDVPTAKVHDYQRSLFDEVQRLSGLVHDVLDFGRLERGRYRLAPRRIAVRSLVAQAVVASRDALRLGRQKLLVDVPRQLPELFVDVEVLVRALRNLLDNATKYAPPSSTIELSVVGRPRGLTFAISDAGPGLEGLDPSQMFEPFQKGSVAGDGSRAPQRKGSGLGLAIVHRAVRAHGGSVVAEDRAGGGAEFRIELPSAEGVS